MSAHPAVRLSSVKVRFRPVKSTTCVASPDGNEYAMDGGMSAQSIPETESGKPASTGRVLIADDQQHVLFALQMLLSGSGFST